jgi:hypothetical protein
MSKSKRREPKKPRELVILGMILACKGGRMRDKRQRRPKDARQKEEDFS